jgi:hypothetical protein
MAEGGREGAALRKFAFASALSFIDDGLRPPVP